MDELEAAAVIRVDCYGIVPGPRTRFKRRMALGFRPEGSQGHPLEHLNRRRCRAPEIGPGCGCHRRCRTSLDTIPALANARSTLVRLALGRRPTTVPAGFVLRRPSSFRRPAFARYLMQIAGRRHVQSFSLMLDVASAKI